MRNAARLAVTALISMGVIVALHTAKANAAFGVSEFEAGTCVANTEPLPPLGTGPGQCTYDTPDRFYTQAAGITPFGIIDFSFNTAGIGAPEGNVLNVRTDLPIGLSVNPEAVPKCTVEQLESLAGCPANTQVGVNYITAFIAALNVTVPVNVYNMVPPDGKPLMAGMKVSVPAVVDEIIYLVGDVNWEGDYHQFFTISDIGDTLDVVRNRLVFNGDVGDGFIRMPTTCSGPQRTTLQVDSHQDEGNFLTYTADTPVGADGCDQVPFSPEISVTPADNHTDSPSAVTVEVNVPQPDGEIKSSDVKDAIVSLPAGMNLNPSAVNGLETCTDAQFGQGTRNPIACPPASRVGSAAIETPVLPEGTLTGNVYVGQPLSNNPASGQQFRLFMDASSERFGVSVRLTGEVSVDPATGQLTTRLTNLPQAPFSTFRITLDGGPRAVLSTPATCGPHTTTAQFTPWTGQPAHQSNDSFTVAQAPGGGPCAEHPGQRPFSPQFAAGVANPAAGAHTRLDVGMERNDGAQEFKAVHLSLPPGLTARLAGVPYCPQHAINAAAGRDGVAERAAPSCPAASRIGQVRIMTGTGPQPYPVDGQAYLAGPYAGAPLSMVVVTPAIAGPYDLGTVVVRVALQVDPRTLEIRAVSDPVPHRVRGVALSIRSIAVGIDRPNFSLNATACWEKFFTGTLWGGGGDPANPGAWSGAPIVSTYQATGCPSLNFAPRLFTRFFGGPNATRRNAHPPFRAVLQPRPGNANIRRAVVRLPRAILLDQGNIRTVCTRDQYAQNRCPARSIYGRAVAHSPLLDEPLRGPVYLRSSDNVLPDLVASMRGQVNVELAGRIDSVRGMLRTTYDFVPDVPVSHFALRLHGGNRGLLVVSRDLCARRWNTAAGFNSQNGKRQNLQPRLRVPQCRNRGGGR